MIPAPFIHHRPTSLADAIKLLADLGEEGRPLAGGHSLIPMMKLRLSTPKHLVDLHGIGTLKGIRHNGDRIVIGAMTTQHELLQSNLIQSSLPILRETTLRSPTLKCAIAARWAAMWPMAIPATTCRP